MQDKETIWILGGGQFGRRAAEQMVLRHPDAAVTIVEKEVTEEYPEPVHVVHAEGIEWFAVNFSTHSPVTRIIPALPVHLAAEWLVSSLAAEGRNIRSTPIPESVLNLLPNPVRINDSRVAVSHATFLCPPDCPEPDDICTVTGEKRPQPVFLLLEGLNVSGFVPLIVRSRQFAPGVGGFFPDDLWDLLQRCKTLAGPHILAGTACKCHGIVDGLRLDPVYD